MQSEFIAFLRSVGGIETPDEFSYCNQIGRLSEGNIHVWVYFDNKTPLIDFEEDTKELVVQKLDGKPVQTGITLEMSSTQGSDQLAAAFISKFSKQYHCVLYIYPDIIYSASELDRLKTTGKIFDK